MCAKVNFISKIGKDSYGELALNTLTKNKINTESVIQDENLQTGVAGILVDKNSGKNAINVIVGAPSTLKVTEIDKMGRAAVDSNQIFIDGLEVSEDDRIGDENKGFYYLLDSLNPERILIAAEALGIGRSALNRAVDYANNRIIFDRPIGKNQSIQHPLAENWVELEAAELLILKAAFQYDNGQNSGGLANAAKYFAAEAAFKAANQAVMTLGGMGYAKDFHVERLLRESMIPRLAPVSAQMVLNYISERILGLPKSY